MDILALLTLLQASVPLAVTVDHVRPDQDVVHYTIALAIAERGATIRGSTSVQYIVRGRAGPLLLDFDRAFTIDSIRSLDEEGATAVEWQWTENGVGGDLLAIDHWGAAGDTLSVAVHYRGAPPDGLIIGSNVHGQRTAFADNWPNRAHHWFPNEDHPSDKATVDYAVEVPGGWRLVANGRLVRVDTLANGRSVWHWAEERPIPVHTMVIGGGPMAVAHVGDVGGAPQSVWAFPSDSAFAVNGPFRRARDMADVLTRTIGPFPYAKLAHVQSATRYGGMENSSAIFYNEYPYAQRSMGEGVVAHELAHQWFGDAVAQADWHHLWLSEGFATYFGDLTFELLGEPERFAREMANGRRGYLRSNVVGRPVIDTAEHDLMALLNANNYQKGGWILHMLRAELGDTLFFAGIREYYATYRDSSVLTDDFASVISRRAGRPMSWFFEQWLLQPGYPQIDVAWSYRADQGTLVLEVTQVQSAEWGDFAFRLPVLVRSERGDEETVFVRVSGQASTHEAPIGIVPAEIVLDPSGTLLMQVSRVERVLDGSRR